LKSKTFFTGPSVFFPVIRRQCRSRRKCRSPPSSPSARSGSPSLNKFTPSWVRVFLSRPQTNGRPTELNRFELISHFRKTPARQSSVLQRLLVSMEMSGPSAAVPRFVPEKTKHKTPLLSMKSFGQSPCVPLNRTTFGIRIAQVFGKRSGVFGIGTQSTQGRLHGNDEIKAARRGRCLSIEKPFPF